MNNDKLLKSFKNFEIKALANVAGGTSGVIPEGQQLVSSESTTNCGGSTFEYHDWKGSDGTWYSDSCSDA